jgi:2-polyprenyl-3-methyl-5-hydroxy-6-metoxy-1,4-benzoquinol methylase
LPEGRCSYIGYDIVACSSCGFLYADTEVSQASLDSHYAGPTKVAQALTEIGEPPEDIVRLDNSAGHIKRFLKPGARVLDVGCGTGRLLSLLKTAGFQRVCGIDQSPAAAHIAHTKYGVEVIEGSIFDYAGEGFDCITACHVMEHIVDVGNFVGRLRSLLNKNGVLYLEVPDVHQFDRFVDPSRGEDWIYIRDLFTHFTPEHVNFFSTVSLRNLITRRGFEELFCESDPLGVVVSAWSPDSLMVDDKASEVLARYADASLELQKEALGVIQRLAESGEEVLVWGAGLHTQRLLGTGNLGSVNIKAYVDSDPTYRGAQLAGKPIIGPDEILALDGSPPILISSWKSQSQIERAIRSRGLPNRTIFLYSNR